MHNIYHQITKGFNNQRQHHTVAVALNMSKVFNTVSKTNLYKHSEHHHLVHSQLDLEDNKHALNKMALSQNSNKSTSGVSQSGVQCPIVFKIYIPEITLLPKDVQIST